MPPSKFRFQQYAALPLVLAMCFASVSRAAPPEPLTLKGHKGWISALAFAPDGKTLATASADKTVKFWDPQTGAELKALESHKDIITAFAFMSDGSQFATASFDGTAKVWSTATHRPLLTLQGHRGAVLAVAFDPNGGFIATGGMDGTLRIWDLNTGKEAESPPAHKSWVNGLAYSNDGNSLATVSSDNEVWLRNYDGASRKVIRPKLAEVRSVAFSPDGKLLAAGTRYGITRVWNTKDGTEVASLKGKHTGDVWSVAFAPDGKTLAVGDGDWNKPSDVVLWDTTNWKERTRLKHTNEVLCIAFHPKKAIIAAGAWDKTVKIWDLAETPKDK